jgi:tetratricopeptide (TPR) repeat protein
LALRFREERSNLAVARKELALAQMNYAEVLVDLGRCDEAQGLARESAETFSEFGTASPPDALCRLVSVPAWTKAGRAARWAGRWEDAESALQQAVKQGRANLPLPGPRPDYRATLASALLEHGIVQASRDGQTDQARAAIDQAVALLEPLTTEFPRVAGHRRWLAEALTARGKLRLATGSADTALADARRAVALLEKLVQESAGAFVYKPPLVSAYVLLSRVEHKQGNSAGAQTSVQNAQRLMEQARPLNPRNPRLDADAAEIKTVLQDIAK